MRGRGEKGKLLFTSPAFIKSREIMETFCFKPIGYVSCDAFYPQETPRQGSMSRRSAVIKLNSKENFEAALQDLDGVSHVWIVWVFDRVKNWKPLVQPPTSERKVGVFATRSPHRPNPIGITAAKLIKIDGLKLYVENIDLLDGTPILDIKPYIAQADIFEDRFVTWQQETPFEIRSFSVSETAAEKGGFIRENAGFDLLETARVQLATRELDPGRQRLQISSDGKNCLLAFRTWRVFFDLAEKSILVTDIQSGYQPQELEPDAIDKYGDLELHRKFKAEFC